MSRGKRTTTTTQMSRDLDLIVTKYAKDHNLSKSEALDELFGILHPEVETVSPEGVAPPETGEAVSAAEPPVEEPDEISDQLTKTAKDLRSVSTIRALQKGLNEEEGEAPITTREAFELKKLQTMFPSTPPPSAQPPVDFQTLLDRQADRYEKLLADKDTKRAEEERDSLKAKLEEKEKAEVRAQELVTALQPLQDQLALLDERLKEFERKISPESKEAPTSAELEAIRTLGTGIRDALVEVSRGKGGEPSEKLKDYLDSLAAIMDRINEFSKRGEAPSGEFDWRTAAINTFGEVAGEGIRALSEIEARKPRGLEEEGEEPQLSSRIIERRVYNYAMKKIAAGELTLNPYEAAKELGLTANEVWGAVETLRKRGALKSPQVKKGVERKETPEKPTAEEGEIIPNVEG